MSKKQSFETAIQELDSIVERMESGQLSLEESLNLFEKGVKLTRSCQKTLSEAEKKIEKLMQEVKTENHSND